MPFSNVAARTTITGFSDAQKASILADMQKAYEGSPTAKAMFDNWIATASNTIDIKFMPGVYQAYAGTGRVEIDPAYITDLSYINDKGTPILHSQLGALVHELGHALTGRRDTVTDTDYQGDNVRYVNQIWKELGLEKEISYIAQARNNIHKVGYQYTNGATIDAAVSGKANWSSAKLGNSKDLLIGNPSANILQSSDGNDFLFGAGGNDELNGGKGKDTAVYYGNALDYDIRKNSDGSWSVKNVRGAKDAGNDTLKNIEVVQFDGGKTYDLKKKGLTFQTDFALVIDTTGSMGSSIGSVKAQASALVDAVFASGKNDGRIGVVGFKDTTNGEPSSVILKFTDQDEFADRKSAAISAINSIGVSGGGDLPETAYDGLRLALNGSMGQWRFGAGALRIALFTDAPAKDGSLASEVNALAKSIGATITKSSSLAGLGGTVDTFTLETSGSPALSTPVKLNDDIDIPFVPSDDPIEVDPTTAEVQIFTIFTGPTGRDTEALSKVAKDNGGEFLTVSSNDELVKKLFEIVTAPPVSEIPTIALTVSDADAAETKAGETTNPGQFTLTRTGATTADLTVNYTITGTATNGTDYTKLEGTVTFKAGSDKAVIDITALDDDVYELKEEVVITLNEDPSKYKLDTNKSGTVTITDNDLPVITIEKGEDAAEPHKNGSFILKRDGDTSAALTVKLAVPLGTATNGKDYETLPTEVTFAAGSATATIEVKTIADKILEGRETIFLAVAEGTGYKLGASKEAHINLFDKIIKGTKKDDCLKGGKNDDIIEGLNGNDTIYGKGGDDWIEGGKGDDKLYGGKGRDLIYGGDGNDTIDGGECNDTIYGDQGHDTIYGGEGHDTVYGGSGKDTIYGEEGNDCLAGEAGDDKIAGDDGNDEMYGGLGNDCLDGGKGHDVLDGVLSSPLVLPVAANILGKGEIDCLKGGAGKDLFVLGMASDKAKSLTGAKYYVGEGRKDYGLIHDFQIGKQGDCIQLFGDAGDYELAAINSGSLPKGIGIYAVDGTRDLVGIIQGQGVSLSHLSLTDNSQFSFVS
jgi:Ca2+-binding RTX toxin-like protein